MEDTYIYIRFSPTKDCGPVLASQIQKTLQLVHKTPQFFIDADKTAEKSNMKQFTLLCEHVEKNKDCCVVIEKLERLGHIKSELDEFFNLLKNTNSELRVYEKHPLLKNSNTITTWDEIDINSVVGYIIKTFDETSEKMRRKVETHKELGKGWGRRKVELDDTVLAEAKQMQVQGIPLTNIAIDLDVPYSVLRRRLKDTTTNL